MHESHSNEIGHKFCCGSATKDTRQMNASHKKIVDRKDSCVLYGETPLPILSILLVRMLGKKLFARLFFSLK